MSIQKAPIIIEADEKKDLREKLKKVLLISFINFFLTTIQLLVFEYQGGLQESIMRPIQILIFLGLLHPIAFYLTYKTKFLRTACYIWFAINITGITMAIIYLGGILSFITITYIPIIIVVAYMLNFIDIIITTSLITLTYLMTVFLEYSSTFPTYPIWGKGITFNNLNKNTVLISLIFHIMIFYASAIVIGIITKISNNRKRAIEESEKRFRDILMSSNDFIWEVDAEGKYTFASGKIKEILGYEIEEIIGKTPFKFMREDEAKRVEEYFKDIAISKGQIDNLENWYITQEGKKVCLLTNGLPIFDQKGTLLGYRGVDKDITEIKEARNSVLRAEKLAAIGQLSSSIAHELRNPLGAIKNAQYYLKKKLENILNPEEHELELKFLNGIEEQVNNSNTIITNLLDFSRQKKLKLEPSKISPIIENILESINIPENIKVESKYEYKNDVHMDAGQMEFVFKNIIINAIQSMEDGEEEGTLTIKTLLPNKEVEEGVVEIHFQDTGNGISEDQKDKIFEPLVTTKTKGTGLGLAIAKNIIDAHNGKISVESKEG